MPNSLELNVSPALLHTFANHPFHVRKDMEMNELVDSIRESGVIVPLIVRSRPEGGYEIISGHRRCEACRELGIEKVPVCVQELTDDEATILMVNSNIQREHVLPSEKAFAYKMKVEAIKHQVRTTSSQVGMKSQTLDLVGKELNESRNQVHRYIRLTYFISPIAKRTLQEIRQICITAHDFLDKRMPALAVRVRVIGDTGFHCEVVFRSMLPEFECPHVQRSVLAIEEILIPIKRLHGNRVH